jgi:glycine cleavage system H protein
MALIRFTKDHEYVSVEGDIATVGISNHAQGALGDVVFVEVPEVGRQVKQGESVAVVESVKAASEVYAPLTGEVTAANGEIGAQPGLVNEDAEGRAWFFKMKIANKAELDALMDKAAYDAFVKESA